MDLKSLLTEYFCDLYKLGYEGNYKIERINARKLIVPGRIDLIAKLKYVEFREKGYDLTFIKELYTRHIEAFTLGTFTEGGNDSKDSIEKYFKTFDSLIDNIKENGLDENISVIPVGRNNEIMDGAHRTAIAAYYNLSIPIIRFENLIANNDTEFFRSRLLDETYLDYLVTEFCKLKDDLYVVILWPRAIGKKQEAEALIQQISKIVYKKNINLSYNGLRNFIIQVYCSHDWIGGVDKHFEGATPQLEGCYSKDGSITAYIVECDSLDKIVKMKADVRSIYRVGNYSIHSSDNKNETFQLANLLFNQNSIDFLNSGSPDYYIGFNKKLDEFKRNLIVNNFSLDEYIIDSSSTLGLYGLRDVGDIDYMTISNNEIIEGCHHDYIDFYETTIDDLVFNPNNYFVYNELKFITLSVLRRFKKNRNEKKDQLDLKLIDTAQNSGFHFKMMLTKLQIQVQRKKRNFKYYTKKNLVLISKKLGLYNGLRKVYHLVRDVRG